jgi:hypothetical protein
LNAEDKFAIFVMSGSSTAGDSRSKMKFTDEEDDFIRRQVEQTGPRCWSSIAAMIPHRTARQVRERWVNYLQPGVNNGPWSSQEDELLIRLVAHGGPKWSHIVSCFQNRTDVSLKNRYILLQRRDRRMVKKAASLLSAKDRRRLYGSANDDAIFHLIKSVMRESTGTPRAEPEGEGRDIGQSSDQTPAVVPWESEMNYDDMGFMGQSLEPFDLEAMWM